LTLGGCLLDGTNNIKAPHYTAKGGESLSVRIAPATEV
jgi:hypothetical protein